MSFLGGTYPSELALFAAQTIKHKVVSDFAQCDEATSRSLRDALWRLLFAGGALVHRSKPVETQLSLALAALAVQSSEELWADPVGMAVEEMTTEANRLLVLQFISHLPEQLMNTLIPLPVRLRGRAPLTAGVACVLCGAEGAAAGRAV